jgi:hypothetical protein
MSEDLADEPFDSVVNRVKETFNSAEDQLKSKVEKSKATALKKISR